jgi:hypothetical protein
MPQKWYGALKIHDLADKDTVRTYYLLSSYSITAKKISKQKQKQRLDV